MAPVMASQQPSASKSPDRRTGAPRVLVPLAEGFEEIEAVTIVDVLRRGGIEVVVAGLAPGTVRGAHGIPVVADTGLASVDATSFDMIVLPGGLPGSTHFAEDPRVIRAIQALHAAGKHVAAICAAPTVLARAGVLAGKRVTSYPSVRGQLAPAEVVDEPSVVESGNLVTSQGPGTALEFALTLVARLAGEGKSNELREGMIAGARAGVR
jgi:4-methyl-5(b-hydroxyethyl)-thiazole monophosphate biosynthesis